MIEQIEYLWWETKNLLYYLWRKKWKTIAFVVWATVTAILQLVPCNTCKLSPYLLTFLWSILWMLIISIIIILYDRAKRILSFFRDRYAKFKMAKTLLIILILLAQSFVFVGADTWEIQISFSPHSTPGYIWATVGITKNGSPQGTGEVGWEGSYKLSTDTAYTAVPALNWTGYDSITKKWTCWIGGLSPTLTYDFKVKITSPVSMEFPPTSWKMNSSNTLDVPPPPTTTPPPAQMPVASILYPSNNYLVRKGESISFQGKGTGGTGTFINFEWDFGDGTPLIYQQNVFHSFGTTGNYYVYFRAEDSNNAWSSKVSIYVRVVDYVTPTPTWWPYGGGLTVYVQLNPMGNLEVTASSTVPMSSVAGTYYSTRGGGSFALSISSNGLIATGTIYNYLSPDTYTINVNAVTQGGSSISGSTSYPQGYTPQTTTPSSTDEIKRARSLMQSYENGRFTKLDEFITYLIALVKASSGQAKYDEGYAKGKIDGMEEQSEKDKIIIDNMTSEAGRWQNLYNQLRASVESQATATPPPTTPPPEEKSNMTSTYIIATVILILILLGVAAFLKRRGKKNGGKKELNLKRFVPPNGERGRQDDR